MEFSKRQLVLVLWIVVVVVTESTTHCLRIDILSQKLGFPKTPSCVFALFKDTLDGSCRYFIHKEIIPVSPKTLSWCHFNSQIDTDRWKKWKQRKTSQSVRAQSRRKRTHRRILEAEKRTRPQHVETSTRRHPLDQLDQSTRTKTAILADKGSRRNCSQFGQTRSHAKNVRNSEPPICIYKLVSQRGARTWYERLSTPQRAPKNNSQECLAMTTATTTTTAKHIGEVLFQKSTKKVLREESQNTPNNQPRTMEHLETDAKYWLTCWERRAWIDNRPHNWRSCTRCNPNRWRWVKFKKWLTIKELDIIPNQSLKIWWRQENPSNSAKSRVVTIHGLCQYWVARAVTNIQNRSTPILLEACTGKINFLLLWHLSSTWWRRNTKNQNPIWNYDSSPLPCTSELLKM